MMTLPVLHPETLAALRRAQQEYDRLAQANETAARAVLMTVPWAALPPPSVSGQSAEEQEALALSLYLLLRYYGQTVWWREAFLEEAAETFAPRTWGEEAARLNRVYARCCTVLPRVAAIQAEESGQPLSQAPWYRVFPEQRPLAGVSSRLRERLWEAAYWTGLVLIAAGGVLAALVAWPCVFLVLAGGMMMGFSQAKQPAVPVYRPAERGEAGAALAAVDTVPEAMASRVQPMLSSRTGDGALGKGLALGISAHDVSLQAREWHVRWRLMAAGPEARYIPLQTAAQGLCEALSHGEMAPAAVNRAIEGFLAVLWAYPEVTKLDFTGWSEAWPAAYLEVLLSKLRYLNGAVVKVDVPAHLTSNAVDYAQAIAQQGPLLAQTPLTAAAGQCLAAAEALLRTHHGYLEALGIAEAAWAQWHARHAFVPPAHRAPLAAPAAEGPDETAGVKEETATALPPEDKLAEPAPVCREEKAAAEGELKLPPVWEARLEQGRGWLRRYRAEGGAAVKQQTVAEQRAVYGRVLGLEAVSAEQRRGELRRLLRPWHTDKWPEALASEVPLQREVLALLIAVLDFDKTQGWDGDTSAAVYADDETDEALSAMEARLADLKKALAELNVYQAQVNARLDRVAEQQAVIREGFADIRREQAVIREGFAELREGINAHRAEVREVMQIVKDTRETLDCMHATLDRTHATLDRTHAILKDTREILKDTRETLDHVKQGVAQLKIERAQFKQDMRDLKANLPTYITQAVQAALVQHYGVKEDEIDGERILKALQEHIAASTPERTVEPIAASPEQVPEPACSQQPVSVGKSPMTFLTPARPSVTDAVEATLTQQPLSASTEPYTRMENA